MAQFFIPVFFVSVGAAVNLNTLNPWDPAARSFFLVGLLLTAVAVVGKLLASYGAMGRSLRQLLIGVGIVPRGAVGLIFAQLGLLTGILSAELYSSLAMMVMITTFVTPPALRAIIRRDQKRDGLAW